jgi:hypothetical protein
MAHRVASTSISIIIPTRNRAQFLPRAIDSARRAASGVEIIVIDDASTDETRATCRSIPDIHYVRLPRQMGQAAARNAGIRRSRTDYVHFLDDDDILLPGSLDHLVQSLASEPDATLTYGQIQIGDQRLVPTGPLFPKHCPQGDIFWELLNGNFLMIHSVVVRKAHCVEVGMFDSSVTGVEDWDLWLRLTERRPVIAIPRPVGVVRWASPLSGQCSSDRARMSRVSVRVQARALRLPRARAASPVRRSSTRRHFTDCVSDLLVGDVPNLIAGGLRRHARANLLTALRLTPLRAARLQNMFLLLRTLT